MAIAVVVLVACADVRAGGGPENVLLVVNEQSQSSKLLANHYANIRKIPESNVVYLNEIPNSEIVTVDKFQKMILEPILSSIASRKLLGSIDYIVYSSGFPTQVSIKDHKALLQKAAGKSFNGKYFPPVASLTSMTFFASHVILNDPTYISLTSNRYFRGPYSRALVQPFTGELLKKYQLATAQLRGKGKAFTDAQNTLLKMSKENPGQAAILYQLARFYATEGDKDNAISFLTRAIGMGWKNKQFIQRDASFKNIKTDPLFEGLVDRVPESGSNTIASHGFRNAYHWAPNGMINGPKKGMRYFLSSMLSVTHNYGISDYDSVKFLSRAVKADFTQPTGTFYFTQTGDRRSKTRTPYFQKSIAELKLLNYQARIVKQGIPQRRDNVLGVTSGASSFDWPASLSKFVPGAIADNLTSYGGSFKIKGHTKCTEFLKYGAAGASGTVTEPFSLHQKFPSPLIHAHYAKGCSLAEAYYQSVHGPYQLILIGDALCQPFATPPKIRIKSPIPMDVVRDKFPLEVDTSQSPVPIAGYEVFIDGVMVLRTHDIENLDLDSSTMSDGYHELRVVAVGRDEIETRGNAILPLIVNNHEHVVTLETKQLRPKLTGKITLKASSNYGNRIIIKQNLKTVAVINSTEGTTKVSPSALGIGMVKLRAFAVSNDKSADIVSSTPLNIEVRSELSRQTTTTE